MTYLTHRVKTPVMSRPSGKASIEISANINRVPEANETGFGRLIRALSGVWNSRLQCSGDFGSLSGRLPQSKSRELSCGSDRRRDGGRGSAGYVTGEARTLEDYASFPGAMAGQPTLASRGSSPRIRASLLTQSKFFPHEPSCRWPRGDTQLLRFSAILVSTFYPPGHCYGQIRS
jgi:hypothetical protein